MLKYSVLQIEINKTIPRHATANANFLIDSRFNHKIALKMLKSELGQVKNYDGYKKPLTNIQTGKQMFQKVANSNNVQFNFKFLTLNRSVNHFSNRQFSFKLTRQGVPENQ